MLRLTKVFSSDATLNIDCPDTFGVDFRATLKSEDAAVFTLPELLELTDFLQQIRPLIVDELAQYNKK